MRHPQDKYEFAPGQFLRVTGENILVRVDPPPSVSKSGLIHFPEGAMEHVINTGEVLAFGTKILKSGKEIPIPDIEAGMGVAFVRFLAEQHTNKQLGAVLQEGHVIKIGPTDVLVAFPRGEEDRVRA